LISHDLACSRWNESSTVSSILIVTMLLEMREE
jgi:hypothetical protein